MSKGQEIKMETQIDATCACSSFNSTIGSCFVDKSIFY